jgi:hypothetical protein
LFAETAFLVGSAGEPNCGANHFLNEEHFLCSSPSANLAGVWKNKPLALINYQDHKRNDLRLWSFIV